MYNLVMANPLTWLSRRRHQYEPLITVEIYRDNLIHNLQEFRKLAPKGNVAPVLKSNAYGHGLIEVAKILEHQNRIEGKRIPFFIIDSYFEAVALRAKGIKTKLLIIGYNRPETILNSRLRNVSFVVTSLYTLKKIQMTSRFLKIHLKIDTGMRRQGILPEEVESAAEIFYDNPDLKLEGLCSHFSDSDNPEPSFTESQIHTWNKIVAIFRSKLGPIEYTHISATFGHRFTHEIDANVSRLGIGLYGIADGGSYSLGTSLKPAMEMQTIITGIKKLKRDETVGYNNTFKATKDMLVATMPVGYFEGLDRRLSNKGTVLVGSGSWPCPIIGRISMNACSIDITDTIGVTVGSPIVAISSDPASSNSIVSMAKICDTIPYEIMVHIPGQLKRVVI